MSNSLLCELVKNGRHQMLASIFTTYAQRISIGCMDFGIGLKFNPIRLKLSVIAVNRCAAEKPFERGVCSEIKNPLSDSQGILRCER
jgi:hypothetical protein